MSDNYPPGAANDPRAPWNQKDAKYTEWDPMICNKCEEIVPLNADLICEKCFEPEEIEDDENEF